MSSTSKNKESIIQKLSTHFEDVHNLPPLAAKIYALLVVAEQPTYTFGEILEYSGASKSSVSEQLNCLINKGKVEFETKKDSRKRHFKTNRNYLTDTLKDYKKQIEKEIEVIDEVINYKTNKNLDRKLTNILKEHFTNTHKNISVTLQKMSQIENIESDEK
ncbi:MAG: GbsR/MarR family transcriptional regulator [Psychroflexus sp.]